MKPAIFVSLYTDARYRKMAEQMKESAEKLSLGPVRLYKRPDLGEWGQNTHHKAGAMLEAMEEFPGHNPVWVDADLRFIRRPELIFDMPPDYVVSVFLREVTGMLWGGLIAFSGDESGRTLIQAWDAKNKKAPRYSDDNNLYAAIRETGSRVWHLPPAYAWNERLMRPRFPGADPVVSHTMVVTAENPALRKNVKLRQFDGQPS